MHLEFKAIGITNEINIHRIAQHFGIHRKFRWEEPLTLAENELGGIFAQPENKQVFFFPFGCAVFVNFHYNEIMDVVTYLKKLEPQWNIKVPFKYTDDYVLDISGDGLSAINNDFMVTDTQSDFQTEMVSTVLAKSVALEKTEFEIDQLLDNIENVINNLYQGKLAVSDDKLAQMSASILHFKLNTLSYIMLLDKPDVTWINEEASALYDELSVLFELDDRYGIIRHKTETLMDITEVFSGLAHAKRGNRLEWAVIILILIEIFLSLIEMFFKVHS